MRMITDSKQGGGEEKQNDLRILYRRGSWEKATKQSHFNGRMRKSSPRGSTAYNWGVGVSRTVASRMRVAGLTSTRDSLHKKV